MKIGKIFSAAAIVALSTTPALAAPAPSSVSSVERVGATSDCEPALTGSGIIYSLALVAGIIAGAIIIVADDDDDQPVSP